jgi:hypothetical protein
MKYIKTYESLDEPEVGDYIFPNFTHYICKIVKINKKWPNPYRIEYLCGNEILMMNCQKSDIHRFATPSEIERYELKIATLKYNI